MELWFTEEHNSSTRFSIKVEEVLFTGRSSFQRIDVLKTLEWGKVLVLDGLVMLTEKDEFIYHEMITHPVLFSHPHPEKVLVVGGGDGGTVREIVKHKEVKKVEVIEIDKMVIEVCKKYLPQVSQGFEDKRVSIINGDGAQIIKKKKREYDVIIIDSTGPGTIGKVLFEKEFYKDVYKALKEEGIMVAQSESVINDPEWSRGVYRNLKDIFPIVQMYLSYIPTYPGGIWSFTLGSKRFSVKEIIQSQRWKRENIQTRYYNPEVHFASFKLPNFVAKLLESNE